MPTGKIVAVVQARLGSGRLPMKSLLCLRGLPLVDWVTRRLGRAKNLDQIMVAVPDTERDEPLLDHLRRHEVPCFAGPEDDVLARLVLAAKAADADLVVRVCADNPLIWGEAVDRLIEHYGRVDCDYAYNHIPRDNRWPDGLGAEVVSRELLEEMDERADKPSQREHCLNYIWDNAAVYRISTFDPAESWLCRPDLKLDVDRPEDFRRLALLPLEYDMDARAIVRVFDDPQNRKSDFRAFPADILP
ncbi:cytidylyltransferase domain-containing protein [Candidatus Desulfovibrio trichonymphae]|uniref:SpsF-like glycosyltransferase putatively involved in cell wall biogenesis n=1 Tax=Candidatus Desulfovibrio trichonymphae TaxID=1725232 RepID=A0A1J1E4S5_9BACT|nr:NTP transferase domain-containing protein [Candidatus Desulfovibrio trichonymphae]BAV92456.1 SpsF-like glycosyltransferase putatively involved in cell wall biogenesis [Candidatus Desulfovibrio trichonymphae]